ncbi:MAG: DUF349 domain-containing protein [Bacteroidales bacterium]|nr:DUF349 domain-containing protein [Bacteroidales bacterium]
MENKELLNPEEVNENQDREQNAVSAESADNTQEVSSTIEQAQDNIPDEKEGEPTEVNVSQENIKEQELPEGEEAVSEPKSVVESTATGQEVSHETTVKSSRARHESGIEEEDLSEKYNSFSREALVEAIENLVVLEDVSEIRKHIGFIKLAFKKYQKEEHLTHYEAKANHKEDETPEEEVAEVSPVVDEEDPLKDRFDAAFTIYKNKKAVFDTEQEHYKEENLKLKNAILEELRVLIDSEEELKKTYDLFRELQERWKQIGQVPPAEKSNLWNSYHFLVEKFFDRVKINNELKDLDLKKNLEAKLELCEKAEELLLEQSITKSFQMLQKLHEQWKEIGPVPKDKKDEIWERFKAATDTLNKRRQDFYDGLRDEQNKNYSAKVVLCEQAEQIAELLCETPRDWQENTSKINELLTVWKTIGFAPKKVNNEVWNRFRAGLDVFFRNKKEYFKKLKDEQLENYNIKLDLCVQAEALKDSTDWKSSTDELIRLQKEWKKIGPVPNKFSEKVWKRFRAACDEFFNRKSDYFSNIGEKQDENLKSKLELIEKVKAFEFTENNNETLEILKGFQREWMEIGHVPIKEKDKVQNEFRKLINEKFDRIKISNKERANVNYKNKLDNIKGSPNADNIIYKERSFIQSKIQGLQNDIKLWENNIGFFASSKKADILKAEFEQKIEKARKEIEMLEEKLKILRDSI